MQSTGQALAHMSQAMHLSASNSWMPRYRGANVRCCSGYCTVTVFWKQYLSVIFIPMAMEVALSKMFLKYARGVVDISVRDSRREALIFPVAVSRLSVQCRIGFCTGLSASRLSA